MVGYHWKDFLLSTIRPTFPQWKGKDIDFDKTIVIPYYMSGEAGLMIDLLFYPYLISAVLTWFNFTLFFDWFMWYVVAVLCLFLGIFIGLVSKYYGKYKEIRIGKHLNS